MLVPDINIGTTATRPVIPDDYKILFPAIISIGFDVIKTAREVTGRLHKEIVSSPDEIGSTIATVLSRNSTPFTAKPVTGITCHTAGINFPLHQAGTIDDTGGQDS